MKLQTVHVRVNDAATGQPTPCRIRISDPSGNDYAPFGRTLDFATGRGEDVGGQFRVGREHWYSIDGTCEIALPPGELLVQVRRDIHFKPLDQIVNQPAGKMAMRLEIKSAKVCSPTSTKIDFRSHFLTPHAALLDAAAEGLDVVNLLIEPRQHLGHDGNNYVSVANLAAFSGQSACLERQGTSVVVNTHNRHPVLGSLGLLHSHRPVFPLTFGGADASDDWSLDDWADQCHRKKGLVIWTEPFSPNRQHAGEALALAILGKIDLYELTPELCSTSLREWYRLLDAGIRLPLAGASGRASNDRPLGALQTLVCEPWVEMLQHGASVTNGPNITLSMDKCVACASVMSAVPFGHLELVANGKVVCGADAKTAVAEADICVASLEYEVSPPAWVAARVIDSQTSTVDPNSSIFAHTSAVVVGEPKRDPAAVAFLLGHLDRCRDWIENEGRFEQPKSKEQLLDTVTAAVAKLKQS